MPVIKATVTRASNGTVDLRPVDPDATDVEVITLAVPNALDLAKKFVIDSEVEVDVPDGRKKAKVAVAIEIDTPASETTDDAHLGKRKKS